MKIILKGQRKGIVYKGFRLGYDPFPTWFQELKEKGIVKVYEEDGCLVLEKYREGKLAEKFKLEWSPYVIWRKGSDDLKDGKGLTVIDCRFAENAFQFECDLCEDILKD